MLIGLLLAISLSVFLTSVIIILTGLSGVLKENLLTGAVIGVDQAVSYSYVAAAVSFVFVLLAVLLLAKNHKK